jgi:hypothetical protein
MMTHDVYRKTPEKSKGMPEAYNQMEDKENAKGCAKLSFKEPAEEEPKRQIYKTDPGAYYDPTELLKMGDSHKDVMAVPVVWERSIG